jgi:hypothetical protein
LQERQQKEHLWALDLSAHLLRGPDAQELATEAGPRVWPVLVKEADQPVWLVAEELKVWPEHLPEAAKPVWLAFAEVALDFWACFRRQNFRQNYRQIVFQKNYHS